MTQFNHITLLEEFNSKYIYFSDPELNRPDKDLLDEELPEDIPFEGNRPQGSKRRNNIPEETPGKDDLEERMPLDKRNRDTDDEGDDKTPPVQL
ncbi:hypothetical protein SAMN05428977_101520 [Nitrosomonas sp. Nm166]|nr:hypothetical protein SAMN05428977_101520 [Nitrosomonas sp. Nm166]